jgi:copper(I)-binding protein
MALGLLTRAKFDPSGECEMRLKIVVLGFAALLPLAAHAHDATSKGVTVTHPWARATPGGATVGAAFLEIRTDKNTSDRLIGVSSPVASRAEVHSSSMEGGVMKMRHLKEIDLKPGESHVLKPMGEHIMLFNLKHPLKEGDLVDLTLNFEKAGPIAVKAPIESMAAMSPPGIDHQPNTSEPTMGDMPGMSPDEMKGDMHSGVHSH